MHTCIFLTVTSFLTQVATVAQLDQTTIKSVTAMEDSAPASPM